MSTWQLFVLTFFSLDFAISLLIIWGLALLMGVAILSIPKIFPSHYYRIKKTVYFGMGIATICFMFASSTAGLLYFPIFLETAIKWLGASYLLVTVAEWRKVSWKEFLELIVPLYGWEMKKQKERTQPAKLTMSGAIKIYFVTIVIIVALSIILSALLS